jgi:hypothetical protein
MPSGNTDTLGLGGAGRERDFVAVALLLFPIFCNKSTTFSLLSFNQGLSLKYCLGV